MYDETPNKEEIDWIAKRMREVYDYDRLKDCDIGYLYNQEFGAKNDTEMFKIVFPDKESMWQGPFRDLVTDREGSGREPLTEAERIRLRMLEKEIETEIHRAYGHRKELRRKHRNSLANSLSDAFSSLGSILPW